MIRQRKRRINRVIGLQILKITCWPIVTAVGRIKVLSKTNSSSSFNFSNLHQNPNTALINLIINLCLLLKRIKCLSQIHHHHQRLIDSSTQSVKSQINSVS